MKLFSLKLITALSFMTAPFFMSNAVNAADITSPKAVVELFTSQGCEACPAADKKFTQIIKNKDLLGLAFHVTYWDRLGWKDTFGDEEFTLRQWNYAFAMGSKHSYTPQVVVNGREQIIGTKDDQIIASTNNQHEAGKGMTIPINVIEEDGLVSINIAANELAANSNLYAVYFDPIASVKIERGMNTGMTIDYANIVRKMVFLGETTNVGINTALSLQEIIDTGYENVAFLLQSKTAEQGTGPITGATLLSNYNSAI